MCYRGAWTTYKTEEALYAVGSPSAEMYIDAWNQYKGSKLLDYKWVASGATLKYGSASANGYAYAPGYGKTAITDFGTASAAHSLTTEANSMFMTSGGEWWLASPSCGNDYNVCHVFGISNYEKLSNDGGGDTLGVCPLVSLGS